ncbi:MAG: hypothetical protein LBP53_04940 [Candidatus Peribacteria bacterium]|jgi:hypothetical protein|nr:hypothetical protein [Candidatus Peribacteria bacterium]
MKQLPRVIRTHSTIVGFSLLFLAGISGLLLSLSLSFSLSVEEVILEGMITEDKISED